MRGLAAAALILCLAGAGCRPKDKIRVEEPLPENLLSVVNTADPAAASQLIRGFHNVEQGSWRWTASKFSVLLAVPKDMTKGGRVTLRCVVPEALVARVGPPTLTATLNGGVLGTQKWTTPGEYVFSVPVPPGQLETGSLTVDFALDKFLAAGQVDARELGLIVSSVALEPAAGSTE